ncbi:hypothetical protein ACS0PU_001805 [Formica fusca]
MDDIPAPPSYPANSNVCESSARTRFCNRCRPGLKGRGHSSDQGNESPRKRALTRRKRGHSLVYHSSMSRRRGDIVHRLMRKEKKSQHDLNARHLRARLPSRQLEYFRLTLQPRTRRSNERCIAQLANRFFCLQCISRQSV